jgi:hypothetical protein
VSDFPDDSIVLHTFFDALDAATACRYLEAEEISFYINNLSVRNQGVSKFQEEPSIAIEILVLEKDLVLAKNCLKRSMHLFPDPEIHGSLDSEEGEEVLAQALGCEREEDAEAARAVLISADLWSTITKILDDDENEVVYSVDVKGKDIERAIAIVESWARSL